MWLLRLLLSPLTYLAHKWQDHRDEEWEMAENKARRRLRHVGRVSGSW